MSFESDTSPVTEPFHSEPAQLSGCGKPAVIGCLVLLLVAATGLFLLMWKARDLLEFAIEGYQEAVIQSLPDDLPLSERRRLDEAFEAALAAIATGDLDPGGLQDLQKALASPPRPGQTLSRDAVLDLTLALEAIAGKGQEGRDRGGESEAEPARVPVVAAASP